MGRPSFSKLELASKCQLPWNGRLKWAPYTKNPYATYGTAVHSVAEVAACWGDAPVKEIGEHHELDDAGTKKLLYDGPAVIDFLNREQKDYLARWVEVPVGLDMVSGKARLLGPGKRKKKNECVGTIDMIAKRNDNKLLVRDWKTGQYRYGSLPSESLQLLASATAAQQLFGGEAVVIEYTQIGDGDVYPCQYELDVFDLMEAWSTIQAIYAALDHEPVALPGMHCGEEYCPVVSSCPATQASMAALDASAELTMPLTTEITDVVHAHSVLSRLTGVKKAVKEIDEALKLFALSTPIPLGDGKVWGAKEINRKSLKFETASRVLEAIHVPISEFVETKLTMGALRLACKESGVDYEETLKALREGDAVSESTHTRYEAVKKK